MQMEVLKPAEVVIPSYGKRVTIIDNSHPLDSTEGHGIYIKKAGSYVGGGKKYSYDKDPSIVLSHKETVNVDSVSASVVNNLANSLLDAQFFDAVTVWNENVRTNIYEAKASPVDDRLLNEISEVTEADIIISLDAIDERDILLVREISPNWYAYPTLDVYTQSFWRIYDVKEGELLQKLVHKDTVFWEGRLMYNFKVLDIPHLKDAILEAAWYHGKSSAGKMVPNWKSVSRTYFTGGASNLSQAGAFIKEQNWDGMIERYSVELANAKKEKAKTLYAYNLALGNELKGDLISANEYIEKAIDYSSELKETPVNDYIKKLCKNYKKELDKRLAQEKLIQLQMTGEQ